MLFSVLPAGIIAVQVLVLTKGTKIRLGTLVPSIDRLTRRYIAISVPHFHLQSDLDHSL